MEILNALYDSYVEAFYWADTGEEDQPAGDAKIAPETKKQIMQDITRFYENMPVMTKSVTWESIGHDIYFTRQVHGVGFWARPEVYGEIQADQLTALAKSLGEVYYYQGDDGLIYQ